jgi:hypothetical protein
MLLKNTGIRAKQLVKCKGDANDTVLDCPIENK